MRSILRSGITQRSVLILGIFLSAFLVAGVQPAPAQTTRTFTGEVTDQNLNCDQTPMKAPQGVTTKTQCVLYWAHFATPPSKYVLYDAATKMTYQLSDQVWVQPYAGEQVQVTGTLDPSTKTIKVTGVKPPAS